MGHSGSLSSGDGLTDLEGSKINFLPRLAEVGNGDLKSLDGGRILFILVLDSSENEDKSVVEIAAGVVVSSFVDLAQLHPVVDFGIEELNSIGSTAHLLSGPRDKDVPVANLAAGVAMSCVFHPLHLLEFEVVVDG